MDNKNSELLNQLLLEREKLLKDNPQLRELQDEIDLVFKSNIDSKVRLEILFMMMTEKLKELGNQWKKLEVQVKQTSDSINNILDLKNKEGKV